MTWPTWKQPPLPTPKVTYTPFGQARAPGFFNPSNPWDTGYAGQKDAEVAVRYGYRPGKVDWWDYDRGAPRAGATLGSDGLYMYGGGGGGQASSGARVPRTGGFLGDPILAQAQAFVARQRAMARAAAAARRAAAAIEYGDPTGVDVDEATARAARENPFSVLASLKRGYERGVSELEEALNAANLFYSGYRGKRLAEEATDYQARRHAAAQAFRALLADIENELAQALLRADWEEMDALQGAYMRALQEALEYGYGYPGSGYYPPDDRGRRTSAASTARRKPPRKHRPRGGFGSSRVSVM